MKLKKTIRTHPTHSIFILRGIQLTQKFKFKNKSL